MEHNFGKNVFSIATIFKVGGALLLGSFLFLSLFSLYRLRFSHAQETTLTLRIKLQGEHYIPNTIKSTIVLFNNHQGKTKEWTDAEFQLQTDGAYATVLSLDSSFPLTAFYAISIKPEGYLGRLFCSETVTGPTCVVPQFIFNNNSNSVSLTSQLFAGGDVKPASGTIDSYDLSSIMADLGKVGENLKGDVTNDGVVNVVDYSIALSSLSRNSVDDPIPQSLLAPPITPTATPSATLVPSKTPIPTKKPTNTPTPSPTPTLKPTNTPTPTPTSIPQLGKKCKNGTTQITKSINKDWSLKVLPIPYDNPEYTCITPEHIVLHWSDSPLFSGNSATWGTLNTRNRVCGLAIDDKETLQMSNFYDDKITWEGCSSLEDSINIEINGTQFDLWYNKSCKIVNPAENNALAEGELLEKKKKVALEYGIAVSTLNWENAKYVTIMKEQEKRIIEDINYLLTYYKIPRQNITGHFKIDANKSDPGVRFLNCIVEKIK